MDREEDLDEEDGGDEDDKAGEDAGLDLLGGDEDDAGQVAEWPANKGVVYSIP